MTAPSNASAGFERRWFGEIFADGFDWRPYGQTLAELLGWSDAMAPNLADRVAFAALESWLMFVTGRDNSTLFDPDADGVPSIVALTSEWMVGLHAESGASEALKMRARMKALLHPWEVWTEQSSVIIDRLGSFWLRAVCEPRRVAVPAPAIPHVVIEPLAAVLSGAVRPFRSGDGWSLHDVRGDEIARTFAPDLEEFLKHASSAAAHALVRYAVVETWRARLLGEPAHERIDVAGGWQALAERMGRTSGSSANRLRAAAMALKGLSLQTPFGFRRVLDVSETTAGGRRHVVVTPIGPLAHGFVSKLKAANKPDRRLVPIAETRSAPKLEAKALALELLLLAELKIHGRRVVDDEGQARFLVSLTDSTVATLGKYVGLEGGTVRRVVSELEGPGGFLERADGNDFRLRSTRQFAEEMLLQGEEQESRGRWARRTGLRRRESVKRRPAASLTVVRPDPHED